jgi:ABC-type transport system substrate-binding protein
LPWPTRWLHAWNNNPHAAAVKLFQDPKFAFDGPSFPTDGPYQVIRLVKGTSAVLEPMKYYDDMTCGGFIQALTDTAVSPAGMIAAAATRHADLTMDTFSTYLPYLPELRRHTNVYRLYVQPAFELEYLELNVDPLYEGGPNPLSDARVRLALALALDKTGLIERALQVDRKTTESLEAWTPWINTPALVAPYADKGIVGQWDPIAGRLTTDTGHGQALADARRLLAASRWKHGLTLDFYTISGSSLRREIQRMVADDWARIGVHTNLRQATADKLFVDWQHGGIISRGAFQIGLFTTITTPDPDGLKFQFQSKYNIRRRPDHSGSNETGVVDPVIDRAFDRASATFDQQVRFRNYRAIQQELNRRAYWIPLYFPPIISTADRHLLHYVGGPTIFGAAWNMYAWQAANG